MSRAERYVVPAAPRLAGAARSALSDFYFNSWRLVPANGVWGIGLLGLLFLSSLWWPFLLLLPFLAVPAAGVYRLAALIAREESAAFSDALEAYGGYLRPALLVGAAATVITAVLLVNLVSGLTSDSPLGWAVGTGAFWGLAVLSSWLVVVWPLVVDPRRTDMALGARFRLAGVLVLAFPLRFGALTLLTIVLLAVSTVLFAALLTLTVAYCALVGCRYVLPAADRFEGRATKFVPE